MGYIYCICPYHPDLEKNNLERATPQRKEAEEDEENVWDKEIFPMTFKQFSIDLSHGMSMKAGKWYRKYTCICCHAGCRQHQTVIWGIVSFQCAHRRSVYDTYR